MELILNRTARTKDYTGGVLSQVSADSKLPNRPICQTLEDPIRDFGAHGEGKIWGKTAIPAGRYRVILSFSKKFGRIMPEVVNVPFYTGIRIHKGRTVANTEGCLMVGQRRINAELLDGDPAFARVMALLEAADRTKEKVFITIVNG